MRRSAFTLIELLVVIAIIALLIGILLPALSAARQRARIVTDSSQLRGLALGTQLYLDDHRQALPQFLVPGFDGELTPVGALFGGKKGDLPLLQIDEVGPERRPLNSYVVDFPVPPDLDDAGNNLNPPDGDVELPIYLSPIDAGGEGLPVPGFESAELMYELLGASYTLNDHAPDSNPFGDDFPTLIPAGGGRMPDVLDTTSTWVIGTHSIYNYDDGGTSLSNRGHDWFGADSQTRASLAFLDGHVESSLPVPPDQSPTTPDYTFLPRPDWLRQFGVEDPG